MVETQGPWDRLSNSAEAQVTVRIPEAVALRVQSLELAVGHTTAAFPTELLKVRIPGTPPSFRDVLQSKGLGPVPRRCGFRRAHSILGLVPGSSVHTASRSACLCWPAGDQHPLGLFALGGMTIVLGCPVAPCGAA